MIEVKGVLVNAYSVMLLGPVEVQNTGYGYTIYSFYVYLSNGKYLLFSHNTKIPYDSMRFYGDYDGIYFGGNILDIAEFYSYYDKFKAAI